MRDVTYSKCCPIKVMNSFLKDKLRFYFLSFGRPFASSSQQGFSVEIYLHSVTYPVDERMKISVASSFLGLKFRPSCYPSTDETRPEGKLLLRCILKVVVPLLEIISAEFALKAFPTPLHKPWFMRRACSISVAPENHADAVWPNKTHVNVLRLQSCRCLYGRRENVLGILAFHIHTRGFLHAHQYQPKCHESPLRRQLWHEATLIRITDVTVCLH